MRDAVTLERPPASGTAPRRRLVAWACALAALALAGAARAQDVSLQVAPAPHYADVPIEVQITADGFEEQPTPEIAVPEPALGTLELVDVSPQVNSQITIVNGRMQQQREVRFSFRYSFRTAEPGEVQLGPFRVTQGSQTRETQALRLRVERIPESDRVGVELGLPDRPVYVGERIPIELRLRLEVGLQERLRSYALSVPLFDMNDRFQFSDPEPGPRAGNRGGARITVRTRSGEIQLEGRSEVLRQGDRQILQVTAARSAVALRAGSVRVPASSVIAEEATAFRNSFFGERVPTASRTLRAADRERTLQIAPLPEDGRPASFSGAVGQGFALDVRADRSVVQVGDPIALTLTLRGEGNLERLALPALDQPGLLPPERFRVPEGAITGEITDGAKRFSAVIRVLDEQTREIPALEFAWFDPRTERYERTRSRPIALQVRPAQVVSADDVLSESGGEDERSGALPAEPRSETPGTAPARPRPGTDTGADLAIERDAARLARGAGRSGWGGFALPLALVLAALALLGTAAIDRRRRELDPEGAERRARTERLLGIVRAAAAEPGADAAGALGRALRQLAAELPDARGPELDALIGECDAQTYAPRAQRTDAASAALAERGRQLADRLAGDLR